MEQYDRKPNGQFAPKGTGDQTGISKFERGLIEGFGVKEKKLKELRDELARRVWASEKAKFRREITALEKGYSSMDEMEKDIPTIELYDRYEGDYLAETSKETIDFFKAQQEFMNSHSNRIFAQGAERKKFLLEYKRFLGKYQKGTADQHNFYTDTIAFFSKAERPRRKPDYVSHDRDGKVSSEYWYTKEGIIRGSKHWGEGVASCDWILEGKTPEFRNYFEKLYGKCDFKDFSLKPKAKIGSDGRAHLTNFDNYKDKELII